MKATIISQRNVPSPALARAGQQDTLIIYTTDAGANDSVIIPEVHPAADTIDTAIRAHELAKGQSVGRTLEL